MISRIYVKENLGFKEALLEPKAGLNVFTGLSGAGKSVLFNAILACFGLSNCEAKLVELDLDDEINLKDFGIEKDNPNTFKLLREKKARYFINNQNIAKRALQTLSDGFISYLSVKQEKEFSNESFLQLLDLLEKNKDYDALLAEYRGEFLEYKSAQKMLENLEEEESKLEDLKEFTRFEIEKIEKIKPKEGEYEELMKLKKKLSKRDKIEDAWGKAAGIFQYESAVCNALLISGISPRFIEDSLNELRINMENATSFEESFDIEGLLDRLEDLASLIKKYGDIKTANEVLVQKKADLEHYDNISFEKDELQRKQKKLLLNIQEKADKITKIRSKRLQSLEDKINSYLQKLFMKNIKLELKEVKLFNLGKDEVSLRLEKAFLSNLSLGELNRLRLAFIAVCTSIKKGASGIIFLDEIDANLSGKEAMSIAKVLDELGRFYQIFAISHLPQLSSYAKNHFLIHKNKDGSSSVSKLGENERVNELARMISGEDVNDEALGFAKTLLRH